ncbi:sigma-E factor negative regulatory protein [Abyssibacter sp.]|jgi:sigma-E factor negative regulatory protein RseA|uniref:sigma-E factor negative regulatory protein n=1 Tax=Abyssibacter sp. TaxID=2320200 RepID=UPI0025C5291F|nr:sigma-E factor negative regulatory protein [Abyssibacter sp.]MCK5859616.1 sigma-E factor negative regulatory protein [Abyssibacter sp.]
MTNETLSACIDGACEDMAEALRSVEASDESRQTWSRYHLIGDAMRARSGATFADAGFASRVMAAIENDEMAPAPSNVTSIEVARGKRQWLSRRTTGWAVAASVAVASLATVSVMMLPGADDEPVLVARDVPSTTTLPLQERGIQPAVQTTGVAPRGPVAQPTQAAATVRWSQMEPDAAQQLNGYLINHSRYRAGPGVGGTLGYARVASVNGEPVEASTASAD